MNTTLALFGPVGWPELVILAIVGVIIFGKRLPEVGRSLGKGLVEFKKGLGGLEEEINNAGKTKPPDEPVEHRGEGDDTSAEEPASDKSS